MNQDASGAFGGASNAARRAMWKREVVQLNAASASAPTSPVTRISLPNGEQIHDISKLYEKHTKKDEQRKAHRFMNESPRSREGASPGRQPLDPRHVMTQKLNSVPDANYDTDGGHKQTLQRAVDDGTNPCLSAFSSTKDRFASTAAYRSSTFASVVKEPYGDPEAIGPGTYRSKKRSIQVKGKQAPTPSYMNKSARFEQAKVQVSLALAGCLDGSESPVRTNTSPERPQYRAERPSPGRGPVLSLTPRFKSASFPERYVSSKQHRLTHDAPDRFYDISPSCRYTVQASVKSSSFRCSAMQSRAHRLSSEAAMVHNTPNFPILPSSTKEAIGPGAYIHSPFKPVAQEDMNFIMMPQHMDRFGLPATDVGFIEARFRRFAVDPQPPSSPSKPRSPSRYQ